MTSSKAAVTHDLDAALERLNTTVGRLERQEGLLFMLRQQVKRQPLLGFGAAIATGYVLGRLFDRPQHGRKQSRTLSGGRPGARLDQGSIFFVGTATTVIRCGGFTVLTDPNFLHAGDHVHLGYGMTSRRLTNPAIEIDALPPLDLCVLSHMHGDHWDRVASARLPRELPVVTTGHAARTLRNQGFRNLHPLDTWDSRTFANDTTWLWVTALPGRHGPGPVANLLPPVMGSMLEWGEAGDQRPRFRLYISGDTLAGDYLRDIPHHFPDIDLALLHLGGTRILGLLVTMDARQGLRAVQIIQPRAVVPIHYNDYPVFRSPVEDFLQAMAQSGLPTEVHFLEHGQNYTFAIPGRPHYLNSYQSASASR